MEMFSEHDDDRKNLIQSLAVMMMMMTMMMAMMAMMMMTMMMMVMMTMVMMRMVTRSVALAAAGLFLFIRFLSNRSFLLASS